MEEQVKFQLPPELANRFRSIAIRNKEVDGVVKSAISAALQVREDLVREGDQLWKEIGETFGADVQGKQWSVDMNIDGEVFITDVTPALKPQPAPQMHDLAPVAELEPVPDTEPAPQVQ